MYKNGVRNPDYCKICFSSQKYETSTQEEQPAPSTSAGKL
jgi:hypothetical protein